MKFSFMTAALLGVAYCLAAGQAGGALAWPSVINVADIDGVNGFTMKGEHIADHAGISAGPAGDVNGDGLDDLIVGVPRVNNGQGRAYVLFGRAGIADLHLTDLSALDGTTGFAIEGNPQTGLQFIGEQVGAAGDVNGDGVGDLLVHGGNATYVIYGGPALGSTGRLLADDAADGVHGYRVGIVGADRTHLGRALAGLGDFNGDGYGDYVLGGFGVDVGDEPRAGSAFVVFGGPDVANETGRLDPTALDGTNGFRINGKEQNGNLGLAVTSIGDLNRDGYADLAVGSPNTNRVQAGSFATGSVYVVLGGPTTGASGVLQEGSFDGDNGFIINGATIGKQIARGLAGPGDIDHDGIDDLIVTSEFGSVFVVRGREDFGFSPAVANQLNELIFQTAGVFGFSVTPALGSANNVGTPMTAGPAGDINHDGIDDFVLSFGANNDSAGTAWVIFGADGLSAGGNLDATVLDGLNGFTINGANPLGSLGTVAEYAGDLNGDGLADLVLTAPLSEIDGMPDAGQVYILFGVVPEPGSLVLLAIGGALLTRRRAR